MIRNTLLILVGFLLVIGCASRPQLYPNKKLQSVGKEQADRDIDDCKKLADNYLASGKGKAIASGAGSGAVVGAAAGAVLGAFTGNLGRGALHGGAVGGAVGGTSAAMSPDQVKRNFVNRCLAERGYEVIGWD